MWKLNFILVKQDGVGLGSIFRRFAAPTAVASHLWAQATAATRLEDHTRTALVLLLGVVPWWGVIASDHSHSWNAFLQRAHLIC